jgi:hypothetical protein
MQMTEEDYNGLKVRMRKLELHNRVWKSVWLAVLLTVGFSLTATVRAKQKAQPDPSLNTTLEAQKFLLKNASGQLMGQLAVGADGKPMLELYDSTGKVTWSTSARSTELMEVK